MCKEFRMLVQQTDWRYVAQCEHDTVHLRWDSLDLSFQPEAFLKLGNRIIHEHTMVTRMFPRIDAPAIAADGPKPCLKLCVSNVDVEFPPSALPELLIVLRIACALVARTAILPMACRRELPNPPLAIQSCPKRSASSVLKHLN